MKYTLAIAEYSIAIEKQSLDPYNWSNRGNTYSMIGEYTKAVSDYNKAIAIDSNNAQFFEYKANNALYAGWYAIAIVEYTKAINIRPSHENYNKRGEAYLKMNNYSEAYKDFSKAITLEPFFAVAKSNRLETIRLKNISTIFKPLELPTLMTDITILCTI
jgi:tetratricopeptide (TPR) repeat protein